MFDASGYHEMMKYQIPVPYATRIPGNASGQAALTVQSGGWPFRNTEKFRYGLRGTFVWLVLTDRQIP